MPELQNNQQGRRRRFSTEQQLDILRQWQEGTPLAELCRTHAIGSGALYRWEKCLARGLSDHSELVPKQRLAALERKIGDRERALGRKALEVDILKKFCAPKGLRLPEGM